MLFKCLTAALIGPDHQEKMVAADVALEVPAGCAQVSESASDQSQPS